MSLLCFFLASMLDNDSCRSCFFLATMRRNNSFRSSFCFFFPSHTPLATSKTYALEPQGAEVKGTVECEAARIDGKFDGVFMSVHSLHVRT